MLQKLLEKTKFVLKQLAEGNIYVQYYAIRLAYHCKFMMPHDPDFNGVTQLPLGRRKSDGLLDVGANLGLAALSLRKLLPRARILSLEPNLLHEDWLAQIKEKDNNFDYRMVGAGESNGNFTLHMPYYKRIPLHTMASLDLAHLKETCANVLGGRCKHLRIDKVPVTVIPVDQLNLSPELIKIDAEGFELPILKGALETIRRSRPHLLLENDCQVAGDIHNLLSPLGYRPYCWDSRQKSFTAARLNTRNVYYLSER